MENIDFENKIKKIFKDTYVEINNDHDKALNVFDKYCQVNECKLPILLNYDTHRDTYTDKKIKYPNLAQWINFCICECGIKEHYWVLPHYFINVSKIKTDFIQSNDLFVNKYLCKQMYINTITKELIDKDKLDSINKTKKEFGLPAFIAENEDFISFTFHRLPFDKFSYLKNKEIALSVDADAFCNSGYDTDGSINNINITTEDLKKEFELFINALYDNNLKISVASLTTSPMYFPEKHKRELLEFYNNIKSASKNY